MAFGDATDDPALKAAWDSFCEQLKQAGQSAFKDANPANPLQRADAFRFLTQNLGQAFDLALETRDPAFPQIHPFTTPTMKLGGDLADFTYRQAWISGEHVYRLSGRRGTARWLNITVQGPRPDTIPGTDWPSLHEPFGDIPEANLFGHQIETGADGTFAVTIGGPPRDRNWLPTTPGSRKLFIREAFDAWGETPTTLTIERIGMATPRPLPSPAQMGEAMNWAGDFVTGLMRDWPEHAWRTSRGVCDPASLNMFPADKAANDTSDAKRGRMAAHMVWRLEPDEALIVEMDWHPGFWLFGMGGALMGSMDFLHRPVSYTPARTKVDGDGIVRLILSHEDPGLHNWLDTQGFSDGNLTYRNLMSQQPATFRTRLVKAIELADHLPPGTARTSPDQRAELLRQRYRAIKLRYGI
ncbi:DUF1214 domain-containing protein [Novosphingobium sp. ST904]|uniref:DUF1214 domain-containing protein n=1 Tax=Novosphingobium sp. ST904 TaxID=1684385 RepID=UPI0006C83A11|nr:DUF1214 domain-containing protein [Novosphingobium sp. ST904]KPH64446.1 hypothetical protein ADT71_11180 [Novosphingobium sp. ST904]TCM31068.1 uncharacterized protein DUF1214 [Novosphingobium sp. ST904]